MTLFVTPRLTVVALTPAHAADLAAYHARNRDRLAPVEPLRDAAWHTEAA